MKRNLFLLVVLVLAFSVVLTACEHRHSFDEDWTYDDNYHWHEANCGHKETDGKEKHKMQPIPGDTREQCEICGYTRPKHVHVYADKYSYDENSHWLPTLCGCQVENAAPHHFVNGQCDVCGYWSDVTQMMLSNLAKSDIWNYSLIINDVKFSGLNALTDVELTEATVSAELQLGMSAELNLEGFGSMTVVSPQLASAVTMKAVIENGEVYAVGDGAEGEGLQYLRCSLEELLVQIGVDLDEIMEQLAEMNSYSAQISQAAGMYEELMESMGNTDFVEAFGDILRPIDFAPEAVPEGFEGNSAYAIDYNALRNVNEILATKTVKEYVDSAFGTGFYDNLPAFVEDLFDKTVNDALIWLETEFGITLDDILAFADELVKEFYPDPSINTVEQLWQSVNDSPYQGSLKDTLLFMKKFQFKTLLYMAQTGAEEILTVDDIVEAVSAMCQKLQNKTAYDLAFEGSGISSATVKLAVDCFAETMENRVELLFAVDNDNVLQCVSVTVKPAGESSEIPQDATQEEMDVYNAIGELNAALDRIEGTIVLRRGYELKGDYSSVVADVNAALNQAA